MGLTLVTPPGAMPVTLAEAKQHCRVDHTDDDAMITLYIAAATSLLDGEDGILGRCLMPQTWDLHYDAFPCQGGAIKIPLPPLIDVNWVKYFDANGDEQSLIEGTDYAIDLHQLYGWVIPAGDWPAAASDIINAVYIQFYAGYPAGVPAAIKGAILECVADMYRIRAPTVVGETVAETTVMKRLIDPYRIIF